MISVHETENLSLQQIEKLLVAAEEVRFEASERKQLYGWIERLLCQQEYARQARRDRGLMRLGRESAVRSYELPIYPSAVRRQQESNDVGNTSRRGQAPTA
jgi:hypothetical protein